MAPGRASGPGGRPGGRAQAPPPPPHSQACSAPPPPRLQLRPQRHAGRGCPVPAGESWGQGAGGRGQARGTPPAQPHLLLAPRETASASASPTPAARPARPARTASSDWTGPTTSAAAVSALPLGPGATSWGRPSPGRDRCLGGPQQGLGTGGVLSSGPPAQSCARRPQGSTPAPEPGLGSSLVQSTRQCLSPVSMTKQMEPREL